MGFLVGFGVIPIFRSLELPSKRIPKKKSSAKRALDLGENVTVPTITEEISKDPVVIDKPAMEDPQLNLEVPTTSAGTVRLG